MCRRFDGAINPSNLSSAAGDYPLVGTTFSTAGDRPPAGTRPFQPFRTFSTKLSTIQACPARSHESLDKMPDRGRTSRGHDQAEPWQFTAGSARPGPRQDLPRPAAPPRRPRFSFVLQTVVSIAPDDGSTTVLSAQEIRRYKQATAALRQVQDAVNRPRKRKAITSSSWRSSRDEDVAFLHSAPRDSPQSRPPPSSLDSYFYSGTFCSGTFCSGTLGSGALSLALALVGVLSASLSLALSLTLSLGNAFYLPLRYSPSRRRRYRRYAPALDTPLNTGKSEAGGYFYSGTFYSGTFYSGTLGSGALSLALALVSALSASLSLALSLALSLGNAFYLPYIRYSGSLDKAIDGAIN
ncbi:hypothetical protein QBC39DRAFT_432439 [Podospora conica]|nr:hypothetical protein QBC39DRAFT_432439 [Schizothecium conicum]